MAAVLGAFGPALIWSVGIAFAVHVARDLGPTLTLAWVTPIGLVVLVPVLAAAGHVHLSAAAVSWLALGDAGNAGGLLSLCHAPCTSARWARLCPIVSIEGGIAAVIATVAGESINAIGAAALTVTVAGVVMTAIVRRPPTEAAPPSARSLRRPRRPPQPPTRPHAAPPSSPPAATPTAGPRPGRWRATRSSWVVSLYGTGAGTLLPTAWAVLPAG